MIILQAITQCEQTSSMADLRQGGGVPLPPYFGQKKRRNHRMKKSQQCKQNKPTHPPTPPPPLSSRAGSTTDLSNTILSPALQKWHNFVSDSWGKELNL